MSEVIQSSSKELQRNPGKSNDPFSIFAIQCTLYLGVIVTNTLLYPDSGGVPLSVTRKIN